MTHKFARHAPPARPELASHCRHRSRRPSPAMPQPLAPLPAEPRLLCSDLVTLLLHGPRVATRELTAVLEEISVHGACVQLEDAIPLETSVRFLFARSAGGNDLTGTVIRCAQQPGLGYFAEIQFSPGCTWSPELYRPMHLFDPRDLAAVRETASGE